MNKHLSKASLLLALLLSSLFAECGCGGNLPVEQEENKETPIPPTPPTPPNTPTPITDAMINRASTGNTIYSVIKWKFLANKLKDLKNEVSGVQIDEKDLDSSYKSTALHYAAILGGDTDIIKALLDRGADKEAKDNDGFTPLHDATWIGQADMVKVLLAAGAEVNAKDNKGNTPLHLAALQDDLYITKALLDGRADKNAKDNNGNTPLHYASNQVVKDLLK